MPAQPAIDLAAHPLTAWDGPLGLPRFERIADTDFAPVFDAALAAHRAEIEAIAADPAEPTVDNTLAALELSGRPLARVAALFWCRAGAHTNETIRALERDIAPRMAEHASALHMNPRLFARLDALHERRAALGLDGETRRVLEKTWKRFVRAGARLDAAGQARLAEINRELAALGTRFGQNVLADEADWTLLLDAGDDLAGLPGFLTGAMAAAAEARGAPGRYAVTLSRSIVEPFLAFSERRDLRETVFRAFTGRGARDGETDNRPLVAETLALRAEKARLLGYADYAAYKLDDTMAGSADAVIELMRPVWDKARARAAEDEAALADLAAEEGHNHAIAAWDWRHYARKLRNARLAFDETEAKPYLSLDAMTAAAFDVAGRLFGLTFEEQPGVAAWHEDVRVFLVRGADGRERGLFLSDPFARASKRSGAWMSALRPAHRLAGGETPIVYTVMNFARPRAGEPALLSLDDARTLFHEFGHALHGLMSDVTWPSISGTAVARDFVELPSQLFEHWLTVPDVLRRHARHHETGAPMPDALRDALIAARNFDAGFATVEFTASALVDMAFHAAEPPQDPIRFEAETLAALDMPAAIAMRHRTPHFLHVFAGDGYSAGYYSYMWSEVLDADAFAAFEEAGDPFDAATAARLARHVYAAGGSAEPEALYTAFRGRMPDPAALLHKKGLA
ncbi:M3 family metallopeptidase [Aquibium sp. A9E412]|uniref:M3 family metallopeptidase n=1 Tax=Aquibium sp. A9E412 TaxID=2976767 RepID=UPI0025B08BCD|nr:M3 family metallopeptidase [Aquibium sp. A9E412]MDN2565655.1 M3 family metallopeptidase [Aquibium sp. A9E412]